MDLKFLAERQRLSYTSYPSKRKESTRPFMLEEKKVSFPYNSDLSLGEH